jgi:hypothetical protein
MSHWQGLQCRGQVSSSIASCVRGEAGVTTKEVLSGNSLVFFFALIFFLG